MAKSTFEDLLNSTIPFKEEGEWEREGKESLAHISGKVKPWKVGSQEAFGVVDFSIFTISKKVDQRVCSKFVDMEEAYESTGQSCWGH